MDGINNCINAIAERSVEIYATDDRNSCGGMNAGGNGMQWRMSGCGESELPTNVQNEPRQVLFEETTIIRKHRKQNNKKQGQGG